MKARERMEQIAASCQRDTKRLNQKWKALYTRTAEARGFLCREAAMLYGLRQKRKKSGKTEHTIGGVAIPNFLQDLNGNYKYGYYVSDFMVLIFINQATTTRKSPPLSVTSLTS